MKILFLGDYSGLHATLARRLRECGHEVVLVSDRGAFMQAESDRLLSRQPGFVGSVQYLLECIASVLHWKNFDVVQLINPNFLKLRPSKLEYFFKFLKDNNRLVCLTLAGNDYHFVKACVESKMFRYSEFRVGCQPTSFALNNIDREQGWLSHENQVYAENVYHNIDAAMAVLPEYYMAAKPILKNRIFYTGIPIEINRNSVPRRFEYPLKFFVGIKSGMELQKGFDVIIPAVNRLCKRFPDKCRLDIVRDLPLDEYLYNMTKADIVLDQIYSYSPATNALQAMAIGCLAASGAEPEFYDFIAEKSLRPIVRLNPFIDIEDEVEMLINNREKLTNISAEGIEFVKRHNDVDLVTDRFIKSWTALMNR
ncbi:MAG: glycosyltransferase [Muribaculaceae bacterium]|nr:glycosyltransferase [Muribaculaceae bacterium]